MGYLQDYLHYNEGNECPEDFLIWSALVTLSTVAGRKIWFSRQYKNIYINLYVCLVGDAGSGKGWAKDQVRDEIISKHFIEIPMSASVQSREDIAKFMSSAAGTKTFTLPNGQLEEFHPFFFVAAELENLLSVGNDISKMIGFLVDLYDAPYFSMSFKRDETKNVIKHPYTTMLVNATPEWMMRTLKISLFEGGLGRRMILVSAQRKRYIANQIIPVTGTDAWQRVVNHLKLVEQIIGPLKMDAEAEKWWTKWYEDPEWRKTDDPVLRQFYSRLEIILLKVAVLMALERYPPATFIDVDALVGAWEALKKLEPGIRKLSLGVGRNEMAAIALQFIDTLNNLGGIAMVKTLQAMFFRDCKIQGREFEGMLNHLISVDKIHVIAPGQYDPHKSIVMTPERYNEWKQKGTK